MKVLIFVVVALATINVATALLGGLQSIDVNDQGVQEAAGKVMEQLAANNNGFTFGLGEIKSAHYKIIAGIQYHLRVVINKNQKAKECTIIATFRADIQTWSVKTNDPQDPCYSDLARHSVVVQRKKRRAGRLLGGKESVDLNDAGVHEAAVWAVNHINGMSNSMYRQVLQKIADGSRQVVNGYKYKLLLYLVSTTCRNSGANSDKTLKECPAADNAMRQQCDASVLYSGGKYSMLSFVCKSIKSVLGGDDHDYKPHGNNLMGGDGHDYKPHGNNLMGGDDHDYKPHGNNLMGGDDHDYKPHGNNLIGGDGHDYKPHGNNLMGGDDHDYKPHGNNLMGGDDHDYKPHGKVVNLIGGDGHEYKPHGNNLMGGDDHDYKPHGKNEIPLLGRDWQNYIPHLKSISGLMNDAGKKPQEDLLHLGHGILQRTKDTIKKTNIFGGDTHDYQPHNAGPCQEYRRAFEEFKMKYQRLYASPKEEIEKFQVFCGNMERVKEYQKMERGSAVYGATQFADISEKEFKETHLGFKVNHDNVRKLPSAKIPKGPVPDAWDWRDHKAVTPVKNQGNCGSCWAFSTTGNIEGVNAIKNKKLVSLSEQELVDCDKVDEGCNGGLPIQAYDAIMKLGGIETEKDYSYEGEDDKCKFNKSEVAVKVTGALNISKNEGDMAAWLFKNGPISIGINAFAMQFYFGGIAHPWRIFCNPSSLDHGVLIVGYGVQGSEPFWIVKNSWGPSWGREGYYYVYRGDGVCGLNTMCTSAIVD